MEMNSLAPFAAFNKIPRLHGACVVTEKIDGTNACVEYAPTETGYLMGACSRNRRLLTIEVSEHFHGTPRVDRHGSDNAGFGSWVLANHAALVRLGYGRHFGEWYGQGIQRGYGLAHKRFALFRRAGLPEGLPANVDVVPIVATLDTFSTTQIEGLYALLKQNGSFAVPGFANPEGLVVFHERSGQLFKLTDAAGPKGQKDDS